LSNTALNLIVLYLNNFLFKGSIFYSFLIVKNLICYDFLKL
jgi:hypothetical protein